MVKTDGDFIRSYKSRAKRYHALPTTLEEHSVAVASSCIVYHGVAIPRAKPYHRRSLITREALIS